MSLARTAEPAAAQALPPRTIQVALIVACLAAFAVAFLPEIAAAVRVWQDSTAYGHCFLVLPIALYLAWDRRALIAAAPVGPMPVAALLAVPIGCVWFAAERLGLMEGRQLAVIAFVQVLFLAVLGLRMYRALAVPLLYLFFLVPFGAFITPWLQDFTASFIRVGLEVLGIPAYVDSMRIEIPEGSFVVAEACAGLRFLIASIAFGVLYAFLIYRSTGRRIVFIAVSIAVPIVANGLRALGIVVLGHIIGSAEAAAADHIVYGWIFFSIVILLLVAIGMIFREDDAPPRSAAWVDAPQPPRSPVRLGAAALLAVVLAVAAPAAARALDRNAGVAPAFAWPAFALPAGCTASAPVPDPLMPTSVRALTQAVACGSDTLMLTVAALPPRANPGLLAAAQARATRENDAEDASLGALEVPGVDPSRWRLVTTSKPASATASSVWIGDAPSSTGLMGRIAQARRSILGSDTAPVLIAVGARFDTEQLSEPARAEVAAALTRFIAAQRDVPKTVATIAAPR